MMKKKEKNIVLLFLYFRFYIVVVCHGKMKLNSCVAPLTKKKNKRRNFKLPYSLLCKYININI